MIFEALLGLALLVGIPAEALARKAAKRPPRARARRYVQTIVEAGLLTLAAGLVAWRAGLRPADLGLGFPPPVSGTIGLALAAALIVGLTATVLLVSPSSRAIRDDKGGSIMPRTRSELRLFVLLSLVIGFGWEFLYRAYLLWWVEPIVGVPLAVLLASIAYALAHGWEGWRPALGSLVAALLFTAGYAVTRSLWWLVAIHTALPFVGLLAVRRAQAASMPGEEPAAA
jgi:membrane protease YdiL (CAAX protease family)